MKDFSTWAVKHRPKHIGEMVGNWKILKELRVYVKRGKFPHLLFMGRPGVGKTTAAEALVNDTYGEECPRFFINASDKRGIDYVREEITDFISTANVLMPNAPKIVILDEAEQLTGYAQLTLKSTMEKWDHNSIFMFTVNNVDKLDDAVKSRCKPFHWKPIDIKEMVPFLKMICRREKVKTKRKTLKRIAKRADGDLRRAINMLQGIDEKGDYVEEKWVTFYRETENMVVRAFESFLGAIEIRDYMLSKGSTPISICKRISENYLDYNITDEQKIVIAFNLDIIIGGYEQQNAHVENFLAKIHVQSNGSVFAKEEVVPKSKSTKPSNSEPTVVPVVQKKGKSKKKTPEILIVPADLSFLEGSTVIKSSTMIKEKTKKVKKKTKKKNEVDLGRPGKEITEEEYLELKAKEKQPPKFNMTSEGREQNVKKSRRRRPRYSGRE